MNAVQALMLICVAWGLIMGFMFGYAEGRDSMKSRKQINK